MLPQLATLYTAERQVGHKRGNTRNNVFLQLAMQERCETSVPWTIHFLLFVIFQFDLLRTGSEQASTIVEKKIKQRARK